MVSPVESPRAGDFRQAAQQFPRLEDEHLAAVAEAALHAIGKPAVGKRGEPLLRERWPRPISAQGCKALPVVRVQMDPGMQREALVECSERPGRARVRRSAPEGRDGLRLGSGERVGRAGGRLYLLRALLVYNSAFEVTLMNTYLLHRHRQLMESQFPSCCAEPFGSIWLRKV